MDINKLKEYFYNNLGTIFWSSILLLGGSIFTIYYAHIRYMPSFDFQSSSMLLGASAITAFFMLVIIVVVFILPGEYWYRTFGKRIQESTHSKSKSENYKNSLCASLFLFPQATMFTSLFLVEKPYWKGLLEIGIILFVTMAYISTKTVSLLEVPKKSQNKMVEAIEYCWASFISIVASLYPLLLLTSLSDRAVDLQSNEMTIIAIVTILGINTIVAMRPNRISAFIFYGIISLCTLSIVLLSFNASTSISKAVIQLYGFGNFEVKTLTLKKEACNYLKAQNLHAINSSTDFCIYKDVIILSSLGENYFIEIGELEHIVAKDLVLSWSRERKTSNAQAENDELAKE
ncbi:hypothetical protein L1077_04300 [Pseudoalteromonas luteoviolacea]|uniref:hypothetical protein n=1 Tax=Pseudoalteromonas luteoviolacea TaxID=43657 RepID=UPI001F1FF31D|nr:hypothetical protein [Pseudoalteromonas luteoviolacea]MCF6438649.1 hypothetical protein [Pseudoalteromonas luteoviolacea]